MNKNYFKSISIKIQQFIVSMMLVPFAVLPTTSGGVLPPTYFTEGSGDTPITNPVTNESSETVEKNKSDLYNSFLTYSAQSGDTLPAIASRFNTTVKTITMANTALKDIKTTIPAGLAIKVPKRPFASDKVQKIIPDNLFVNGAEQIGFDVDEFINKQPGWLKNFKAFDGVENRSSAYIIKTAAQDYSISPRVLLALLEYQSSALSQQHPSGMQMDYPMGYYNSRHSSMYNQIMWVSRVLNDGYYNWRAGETSYYIHLIDPRQNAASIAIQNLFARISSTQEEYEAAVSESGFLKTYNELFGDAWQQEKPHLEENLTQPTFKLPFEVGKVWAFTGGPHTGWGSEGGQPWAALDFAPPSTTFGCMESNEWVTAVASGVVVRSENGLVTLDLDGDGDERTGWVVMYFHIGTKDRVAAKTTLKTGDKIGHPSCEGGRATGSHVHIARLYNGEWILAYGPLAFNLEGWIAHKGNNPYQGTLSKASSIVYANTNANDKTLLRSEMQLAINIE